MPRSSGYQRIAIAQANAGAHLVGPSGMMDGQVAAIRSALDGSASRTSILAYAASSRARCTARSGRRPRAPRASATGPDTRRTRPISTKRSAIRTDIDEGADIVMAKPAPYLDVIRRAKDETFPMAAYHVSGEYAMVKAAAQNGWLDERASSWSSHARSDAQART